MPKNSNLSNGNVFKLTFHIFSLSDIHKDRSFHGWTITLCFQRHTKKKYGRLHNAILKIKAVLSSTNSVNLRMLKNSNLSNGYVFKPTFHIFSLSDIHKDRSFHEWTITLLFLETYKEEIWQSAQCHVGVGVCSKQFYSYLFSSHWN